MDDFKSKARLIAYYLPQYYPTKENNEWWGEGFTEWTNVGKAKPQFKGHYQPRVPADLGYYDLRLPEVRQYQATMAKEAGIEGFCYWHYWFGDGKRLLDRVFDEVVKTGSPDFPFCIGWANETWMGWSHGLKNKLLIEQQYLGLKDYEAHFMAMLPAFLDKRYITVEGKPLVLIYQPRSIPNPAEFMDCWNNLAIKNGLLGMHFVAHNTNEDDSENLIKMGYDAVNMVRLGAITKYGRSKAEKAINMVFQTVGNTYEYKEAIKHFSGKSDELDYCYPGIYPNWDHSPRSGKRGFILHGSTPELFRKHVRKVLASVAHKIEQKQIVFIKSWNEWGEGNYLEPDLVYGKQYLDVLKEELNK